MELYACITGADRGLGFELAKALLGIGYTVFAGQYNRQIAMLDELSISYPGKLYTVGLDVSDDDSVRSAFKFISSKTGSLDLLINNSAILGEIKATIYDTLDFDEMQRVFNVNAIGALRVTNSLLPLICAGEKKLIVYISSEAGSIGSCWRTSWYSYCMSKAALNMNAAITHNKLREIGGQVILVHPGWMKSWMSGEYSAEAPLTPDIPAGHIIQIIQNSEQYKGDQPAYIDYLGNPLEW